MKYSLDTAKVFYEINEKDIGDVQDLMGYGMEFSPYHPRNPSKHEKWSMYKEEEGEVEINTLGELRDFIARWGAIVVSEQRITIYNDYME